MAQNQRTDFPRLYKDLVLLFYPAVLGGMFLDALHLPDSGYENIIAHWQYLVLFLAILAHYIVDYIYTIYIEKYGAIAMVLDLIVILLLYSCERAIDISAGKANLQVVSACFAATYSLFLIIDLTTIFGARRLLGTVVFELLVAAAFWTSIFYWPFGATELAGLILVAAGGLFVISPKPKL